MASVHALADLMSLLLATASTFQQIAKIQRTSSKDAEIKDFYACLTAYCSIIHDHIYRISLSAARVDDQLLLNILTQFEMRTTSGVRGEQPMSRFPERSGLRVLNRRWYHIRKQSDSDKLEFIRQCLSFGTSPEERNEFTRALDSWEYDIRIRFPEDPTQWTAEDFAPQKKIREPSYSVRNAAQAICNALIACDNCSCSPQHEFGARIALGTYRKPDLADVLHEEFDFSMFLSIQEWWQEAQIHTAKETAVRFAVDKEARPTKMMKTEHVTTLVKQLCEPIMKIKSIQEKDKTKQRLELKVLKGHLYKLRSAHSNSKIDREKDSISLEEILRSGASSFTERTRRVLAVLLGYAVLHLYDTPWLRPSWSSSSIVFFRTATSDIPLQPFLQAQLSALDADGLHTNKDDYTSDAENIDPDDIDPNEIDPDDLILHQFPILVTLGVMLIEVYFATPFDALAAKYNVAVGEGSTHNGRYYATKRVFEMCKGEFPENFQFHYAVEMCLNPTAWEDDIGRKLDTQALRTKIYKEVVRPLENDLSQAFSSISLDHLDNFAQTLDFGRWDQITQNQQASSVIVDEANAVFQLQNSRIRPMTQCCMETLHSPMLTFCPTKYTAAQAKYSDICSIFTPKLSTTTNIEYKASRFFDDETLPQGHTDEAESYLLWKRRYEDVYAKYIVPYVETSQCVPVKIAVLDTGIDKDHPDFDAREQRIREKYNWLHEMRRDKVPDRNGHGTFTAGLLLDYAPDSELYVAKIADNQPSNATLIARAIRHAVDVWKVDIISLSFGFPDRKAQDYEALENAIKYAYSQDILIFAAASNSGGRLGRAYPARDQNVICIHSTDTNGNRSAFSPSPEIGDINLATVGEAVESSWPVHKCDEGINPSCVASKSGTSYATPIAAGIAAFLLLYVRLHLPQHAAQFKKQRSMKNMLEVVTRKGGNSTLRDGYHFIDVSLFSDSLFGNDKIYIDATLKHLLN